MVTIGHSARVGRIVRRLAAVVIVTAAVAGCSNDEASRGQCSGVGASCATTTLIETTTTTTAVAQPNVVGTTTTPTTSSTIPAIAESVGVTIGGNTETLTPTGYVYMGPIVVSQGPAAAFVPGVGIVGTTSGDVERHFDLGVIDHGAGHRIGVRVGLTPALVGGPDGRLYVADIVADRLSAYRIVGGVAKLVARATAKGACEQIEVGPSAVSCGDASILLGPTRVGPQFTVGHLDPSSTTSIELDGATAACTVYVVCQRWDLGNGRELWALEVDWTDPNKPYQTALVTRSPSGQYSAVLIDGQVAALDPATSVMYAWTDIARLSTYDLAHLLS